MRYRSTRDQNESPAVSYIESAEAIKTGLAPDGGLFVPEEIPALAASDIEKLRPMSYPERAAFILSDFLTDYSPLELADDCREAYDTTAANARFTGAAAPLRHIGGGIYPLELWHGPTAAFKDMALQIMPRLLSRALVMTKEERTALILVATSGDTGKAALEGYRDVPGVKIMVFYPENGVSRVQKLQMATQQGANVNVQAIDGNFDDAQAGVKRIFADDGIKEKLNAHGAFFSSANSINWGRLCPQIVYYVSAYCDLINGGDIKPGDEVNVTVPTGNFGNIFAAYIAKRMGLPLGKLVCASNKNNILTDFLATGVYDRNRVFYTTMSPSMDILISSNLERLLFFTAGCERTAAYMSALAKTGAYSVDADIKAKIDRDFAGYFADETETAATIKETFERDGYLADTHTAVGLTCARKYKKETGDERKMIVASTASPYKFANDVYAALTGEKAENELAALDMLAQYTKTEIPYPLRGLSGRKIRFYGSIEPSKMADAVLSYAGKK